MQQFNMRQFNRACSRAWPRALTNLLRLVAGLCPLFAAAHGFGQAALLLEQPYGVFGTLNPTGHAAIYLERVCADTPVHLRECTDGETGIVISRYKGMAGYDWVAIPLIPYLYAVDDPAQVPPHVDEETVNRLRDHYREVELGAFGEKLPPGNFMNDGWAQLVGTAYDRRTYAFRFETTREQVSDVIRRLNDRPNRSHFNILFNNCADFDRFILKSYFPKQFGRTIFPDAGISTPKHITYSLVNYAKRHPETALTVLEIPQVPGYRRQSRNIHGVTESLLVNGYVVPIVVLNPYIAGGLLADYLLRGSYHLVPKDPVIADAEHMNALTGAPVPESTPASTPSSTASATDKENTSDAPAAVGTGANEAPAAPGQTIAPGQFIPAAAPE